MGLAENYQEKYATDRAAQAHTTEHDELLTGLDRVQRAVLQGHQAQIAALASVEPQVTVKNQVEAAGPKDINKVVSTLQDLIAVQKKQKATDIAPVVKAVNQLVPLLRNLPKQIDIPDNETVEVANLGELGVILEDIALSLKLANERESAEAEKTITVNAPDVVIQERELDLSPLIEAQERVIAAINEAKVVIPDDDDSAVIAAVAEVKEAIANIRFPTPNFIVDPTIKYRPADLDNTDVVRYFGFTDVSGQWYIMQEDTTLNPTTVRYIRGTTDYVTNWTNRASLSYDYFHNVF